MVFAMELRGSEEGEEKGMRKKMWDKKKIGGKNLRFFQTLRDTCQ